MKKFAGVKTMDVIRAQCKAEGVALDDYGMRMSGADYVCLGAPKGVEKRRDGTPFVDATKRGNVMFSAFNGSFFGTTPEGIRFHSDDTNFEHTKWFRQLLEFFYTGSLHEAAERDATAVELTLGGVALLAKGKS